MRDVTLTPAQSQRLQQIAKRYEAQGEKFWVAAALAGIATFGLAIYFHGMHLGAPNNTAGYIATVVIGIPLTFALAIIGKNRLQHSFMSLLKQKINTMVNYNPSLNNLNIDLAIDEFEKDLAKPSLKWFDHRNGPMGVELPF